MHNPTGIKKLVSGCGFALHPNAAPLLLDKEIYEFLENFKSYFGILRFAFTNLQNPFDLIKYVFYREKLI